MKVKLSKIDKIDKKILRIISNNPLMKNIEISEKANIDRNTVKNRINQMINNKIIFGFRAWFDVINAGYQSYKLIIRLNRANPEIEQKFESFARVNKHIIYFNKILGDWEYEYDIETETEEQFRKLLAEIKNHFSDSIKDYEILTINKNYKLNYLPPFKNI